MGDRLATTDHNVTGMQTGQDRQTIRSDRIWRTEFTNGRPKKVDWKWLTRHRASTSTRWHFAFGATLS